MNRGTGTSAIRSLALLGLVGVLLGGSEVLAARNCVSDTGKGRSARTKNLKAVGLTADGRLLCFAVKAADKAAVIEAMRTLGYRPADDNEADALALLRWATAKSVQPGCRTQLPPCSRHSAAASRSVTASNLAPSGHDHLDVVMGESELGNDAAIAAHEVQA